MLSEPQISPLLVFDAICTCNREAKYCRDAKRVRGNPEYQLAKFTKWFVRQPYPFKSAVRMHIRDHRAELLPERPPKRSLWPLEYHEIYAAMLRVPEPQDE